MSPFAQAVDALRRNAGIVAGYLCAVFVVSVIHQCIYLAFHDMFSLSGPLPVQVAFGKLAFDLFIVAASALVQSVSFSLLARDLDRTLWRLNGVIDAIRRFFSLWFVIDLILVAIIRILDREGNPTGLANAFSLLLIVWFVVGVPLGSAIMFAGRIAWSQLLADLRPLGNQFHHTLFVLLLMFFEFYLFISIPLLLPTGELSTAASIFVLPLFDVALGLIDVLAFTWIFLICKHDRDAHKDDSGVDF